MRNKVTGALFSALLVTALTLGAIEGASRMDLLPCFPNSPNVWEPNPEFGWFHRPGTSGWGQGCVKWQRDWQSYVEINDQGLRDDESHPYEKPQGVFRVLLLGDSFTEGFTVDLDEHFAPELERRLAEIAGRPVEVLNSGVSAWGNAQEFVYYMREGVRYSPDLVLLLFNPANDVGENIPGLGGTDRRRSIKPWLSIEGGKLVLRDYPAKTTARMPGLDNNSLEDWLVRRTHVYPILQSLYQRIAPATGAAPASQVDHPLDSVPPTTPVASVRRIAASGLQLAVGTPSPTPTVPRAQRPAPRFAFALETLPPAWENAWWVTKAILLQTRHEVTSRGTRFAVAVVPSRFSVTGYEDSWFDGKDQVKIDHRLPQSRAEQFLTKERFDTCLLEPAFRAHFEQTGRHGFHTWDVHWSPEGHAIVAAELATCLRNLGLIPTAARD